MMTEEEWLACENAVYLFSDASYCHSVIGSQRILETRVACLEQPQCILTHALRNWLSIAKAMDTGEFAESGEGVLMGRNAIHDSYRELNATPEGEDRIRMAATIDVFRAADDHAVSDHIHYYNENGDDDPYYRSLMKSYCPVIREIFGNPFRRVTIDPSWLTSTVRLLARGIYDERAFDRLPILADALQDAGCDSDDLLNHLRDPHAMHVHGCWALDLVLGKE